MASWAAEHVWVVALAVGALLLAAVKEAISLPTNRKPSAANPIPTPAKIGAVFSSSWSSACFLSAFEPSPLVADPNAAACFFACCFWRAKTASSATGPLLAVPAGGATVPWNAGSPSIVVVYREILVHLAEVNTSENLHNGRPSTLLRSVPVENERCRGGWTESFPFLQYKSLAFGAHPQLTLTVLDVNGKTT